MDLQISKLLPVLKSLDDRTVKNLILIEQDISTGGNFYQFVKNLNLIIEEEEEIDAIDRASFSQLILDRFPLTYIESQLSKIEVNIQYAISEKKDDQILFEIINTQDSLNKWIKIEELINSVLFLIFGICFFSQKINPTIRHIVANYLESKNPNGKALDEDIFQEKTLDISKYLNLDDSTFTQNSFEPKKINIEKGRKKKALLAPTLKTEVKRRIDNYKSAVENFDKDIYDNASAYQYKKGYDKLADESLWELLELKEGTKPVKFYVDNMILFGFLEQINRLYENDVIRFFVQNKLVIKKNNLILQVKELSLLNYRSKENYSKSVSLNKLRSEIDKILNPK